MQNKKLKADIESENKENLNNLSNCISTKLNANMIFLKDSQNLIDSKCEKEYKNKLFVLNKSGVEKKETRVKQNLFHVKKNSDIISNNFNNNFITKDLNNLNNNSRSINTSKICDDMINIQKENTKKETCEISDDYRIIENLEKSSEIQKEEDNLFELNNLSQVNQLHIPQLRNQIEKKEEVLLLNQSNQASNYLNRENSTLIKSYGSESYQYIKHIENDSICKTFLYKHKINPEIRSKMVDWMIEVLAVYKSEAETFFLSVYLMDSFINNCNIVIKSEDVHLIGVTCMFMATKFEDIIPIRISCFVNKISHGIFSE